MGKKRQRGNEQSRRRNKNSWWASAITEVLETRRLLDGTPHLLKDVYTALNDQAVSDLVSTGQRAFFSATNGLDGQELWTTDGTDAGLHEVKDIYPGRTGGSPYQIKVDGQRVFFGASDGASGGMAELWVSDGTAAGTSIAGKFDSILTGPSNILISASFNGEFYFIAKMAGDIGLWRTDGTAGGTAIVYDFTANGVTNPQTLQPAGSHLFFVATTSATGDELWSTDGTTTAMVSDINPGTSGSAIVNMASVGNTVFFGATTPGSGSELWTSDGTAGGTQQVKDINPGAGSSGVFGLTALGSSVVFSASDGTTGGELWTSDGTSDGTIQLADLRPGSLGSFPTMLGVVGSSAYFRASDGSKANLYSTDGTAPGTVLVGPNTPGVANLATLNGAVYFTDVASQGGFNLLRVANGSATVVTTFPFTTASNQLATATLVSAGNSIYFNEFSNSSGTYPIYRTDGTAQGTAAIETINLTTGNGFPTFSAAAGPWGTALITGAQGLWTSDGSSLNSTAAFPAINPTPIVSAGGMGVFFDFDNATQSWWLWRTDGTASGTYQVVKTGFEYTSPVVKNGNIYFVGTSPQGPQIFEINGTTAGTTFAHQITFLTSTNSIATIEHLAASGSNLYFDYDDGVHGDELWVSMNDGTPQLIDINPGSGSSNPVFLTPDGAGGIAYVASDGKHGNQLWASDTTGAVMITNPGYSPNPGLIVAAGSKIFFAMSGLDSKAYVFSDISGTVTQVAGPFDKVADIEALNGSIALFAADDGTGMKLYNSDGSAGGTSNFTSVVPTNWAPSSWSNGRSSSVNINGVLYFQGSDANHGSEIFKTDGTAEGTTLVADIVPGPDGSFPLNMTYINGTLYFTPTQEAHGAEVWAMDLVAHPTAVITAPQSMNEATATAVFSILSKDANGSPAVSSFWVGNYDGADFAPDGFVNNEVVNAGDGPGTLKVALRVKDANGIYSPTQVASITISNVPPTAQLGTIPANLLEGGSNQFTASANDPSSADVAPGFTYAWTISLGGNVVGSSAGPTFTYQFPDNGSYTVSVTATDKDGGVSAPASSTFLVGNVAPTATFSASTQTTPSQPLMVSFGNQSDVTADIAAGFTYSYDFNNDGIFDLSNVSAASAMIPWNFLPADGSYTARGRIIDKDKGSSDYTTTVVVTSVPLAATFSAGGSAGEGSTPTASFTNASGQGPFTYSYDFNNDGVFEITGSSSASAPIPASFLDDGPGSLVVHGRIASADAQTADYTSTLTILNVPPSVAVDPFGALMETGSYTFSATASDPSKADNAAGFSFSWTMSLNNTTVASASTPTLFFTFPDNGPYVLSVTAKDKDGAVSAPAVVNLNVADVPPTASFTNSGVQSEGADGMVSFTNQADVSAADMAAGFHYSYDFNNDGVFEINDSPMSSIVVPGAFLTGGTAVVHGRIKDKDGGFTDYTTTFQLSNVAPTALFSGSTVGQATPGTVTFSNQLDTSPADVAAGFIYSYDFDNDGVFDVIGSKSATATLPPVLTAIGPMTRTVRARIADQNGAFTDYTTTVDVTADSPLTIAGANSTVAGAPYSVSFGTVNNFQGTVASWSINWGDGSAADSFAANSPAPTHVFVPGVYNVVVSATDQLATYSSNPLALSVVPPTAGSPFATPPVAALAKALKAPRAGASAYELDVTYTDDVALNMSTLGNDDVLVTTPGGATIAATMETLLASTPSSATVRYRFDAPGGSFNAASSGTYLLNIAAGSVTDSWGNPLTATNLGQFSKVVPSRAPDLSLAMTLSKMPTPVLGGSKETATLRIKNLGNLPATGAIFNLSVAISPDSSIDDALAQLVTAPRKITLGMGKALSATLRFILPANFANGLYHLIADLSSVGGAVAELNEVNNDAASGAINMVKPTVNLHLSSASASAKVTRGHVLSSIVRLSNLGTAKFNGPVTWNATLVANPSDSAGIGLRPITQKLALKSNGSLAKTLSFLVPSTATPGVYYVLIIASPGGLLPDTDLSDDRIVSLTAVTIV